MNTLGEYAAAIGKIWAKRLSLHEYCYALFTLKLEKTFGPMKSHLYFDHGGLDHRNNQHKLAIWQIKCLYKLKEYTLWRFYIRATE